MSVRHTVVFDHTVGPDLGPNCLQRLSADDKSHYLQVKSKIRGACAP